MGGDFKNPQNRFPNAAGFLGQLQEKCFEEKRLFSCGIELLTRCQMKCIHCYLPQHHHSGLSRDVLRNLLDQLFELRCMSVGFSGGEIFLQKDLFDILGYATQKNFFIRLKTNGALIKPGMAKKIAGYSILQIDISLYGPNAAIHDGITRRKGSFEATLGAIRALKKNHLNVNLSAIILKQNVSSFRAIAALGKRLRCKVNFSSALLPRLDGDLAPLRLMASKKSRDKLDHFVRQRYAETGERMLKQLSLKEKTRLCRRTWATSICVRSNGDVVPCTLISKSYGNILRQPLSRILKNPLKKYLSEKISIADTEGCSACVMQRECWNCRGLAYIETKEILGSSRLLCYYNDILSSLPGGCGE